MTPIPSVSYLPIYCSLFHCYKLGAMIIICFSVSFLFLQRHHIGDRSLSLCNMFLDEMAKQARNLITDICTEQCTLSDQVGAEIRDDSVLWMNECARFLPATAHRNYYMTRRTSSSVLYIPFRTFTIIGFPHFCNR